MNSADFGVNSYNVSGYPVHTGRYQGFPGNFPGFPEYFSGNIALSFFCPGFVQAQIFFCSVNSMTEKRVYPIKASLFLFLRIQRPENIQMVFKLESLMATLGSHDAYGK